MARFTISTMPPGKRPSEAQIKRARFLAAALGTLSLIAVAAIAWSMWPEHIPDPHGDPVVIVKFAATPAFARLPREKQDPYIDHMIANFPALWDAARNGQFTPEEQKRAFDNVFGSRSTRHVEEYFKLKTPKERQAYIDDLIKQQEKQSMMWSAIRNAGGGSGDRWMDTGRIKDRVENMPPGTRTEFAELVGDVRRRRQELGLSGGARGR
jgi:hypothetical protein